MAYGFYFDSSKCSGCKSCQVACKETNQLGVNNLWRRVYNYQGGSWEQNEKGTYVAKDVFGYFVSIACNHCDSPACVENCPTGSMSKDPETGIVKNDPTTCIGCQTCVTVCPYNAPTYVEEQGISSKCHMCFEEVARGRTPICVATCPMRALDWGEIDDLRAKYGEGNAEVEPLPAASTAPCLVLNPHPAAQASGQGTGSVVSLEEELSLA